MDAIWEQRRLETATYYENLLLKLQEVEEIFNTPIREEPKYGNDLYFSDGIRKIDYIFVYKRNNHKKYAKEIVNNYIKNLEKEGVQFEVGDSELHPELLFIKVHVLRNRLIMCSVLLNFEPIFMSIPDAPIVDTRIINIPFMNTDLDRRELFSDVVQRASESALGARPKDLTCAERIMITWEVLKNVSFGSQPYERGLEYLLKKKYIETAYPLHDQPGHWTDTGFLNDRQLLRRYWASYTMAFKYQPLELINKYFGPEIAFYFAFLGFYNQMLLPVAVIGTLAFFYGVFTNNRSQNPFSTSVCHSDKIFCPTCQSPIFCNFVPVSNFCYQSKIGYLFDNMFNLIYAIIMCFWATMVTELWKRKEAVFKYKWNLLKVETDYSPRPEYSMKATHKRVSKTTGKYEYYIPEKIQITKVVLSWMICLILVILILLTAVGVIGLRLRLIYSFYNEDSKFSVTTTLRISNIISIVVLFIFMLIFDSIYKYIATKLTDFECPRTQAQYERSYIWKLHILTMINAYTYLYYTAFFKGLFLTYPGAEHQYNSIKILNNDADTLGAILPLSLQLIFFFTTKTILFMFIEATIPILKIKWNLYRSVKKLKSSNYVYNSWEKDYHRVKIECYDVTVNEFKTIITQYGYLILFPVAFPLGPLFGLIANIIELRIDAYKLIRCKRRPIPMRPPGIGAWLSIISTMSYIGIITNCFLIAFTTNFVYFVRMFYLDENIDMLNTTYSVFNVDDYPKSSEFYGTTQYKECLYKGSRFSAYHPRKYELNTEYWFTLCNKLITVIILEVMVLGFNKLLSYAIPDMPYQIKERIHLRKIRDKTARAKRLNEKYQAEHKNKSEFSRREIANNFDNASTM